MIDVPLDVLSNGSLGNDIDSGHLNNSKEQGTVLGEKIYVCRDEFVCVVDNQARDTNVSAGAVDNPHDTPVNNHDVGSDLVVIVDFPITDHK